MIDPLTYSGIAITLDIPDKWYSVVYDVASLADKVERIASKAKKEVREDEDGNFVYAPYYAALQLHYINNYMMQFIFDMVLSEGHDITLDIFARRDGNQVRYSNLFRCINERYVWTRFEIERASEENIGLNDDEFLVYFEDSGTYDNFTSGNIFFPQGIDVSDINELVCSMAKYTFAACDVSDEDEIVDIGYLCSRVYMLGIKTDVSKLPAKSGCYPMAVN